MKPLPAWRLRLASIFERLLLVLVGSWLMIQYIDLTHPEIHGSLRHIESGLLLSFWLLWLAIGYLRPPPKEQSKEPSPRWSGASVVLMTGLAGTFYVARNVEDAGNIWAAVIGLATLAIAAAVWRFATVNAQDIGEAKFDTNS